MLIIQASDFSSPVLYRASTEDFVEFPLSEASRLFNIKGFDKNSPTVIYIHGFIETAENESVKVMVSSYLEEDLVPMFYCWTGQIWHKDHICLMLLKILNQLA
ncbi:hypothetical protein ACJJTC_006745 [Scirpophaga incertulas]